VRSTTLRDFHGYVHFVPNGEMKVVTNRSREWNRVAVDVIVASQGVDRALQISRQVLGDFNADAAWRERLLDPVEVWGVESATGDAVTLRSVVRARPGKDAADAARELRRRLVGALTEAGLRPGMVRDAPAWPPVAPTPSHPALPEPSAPDPAHSAVRTDSA
jgi:small conductance mechanosensitive channel